MKSRLDMLAREIVTASIKHCESDRAQQLTLARLEIFEDARKMQSPGGVGVGPSNPSFKFNRSHSISFRIADCGLRIADFLSFNRQSEIARRREPNCRTPSI